MTNTKRLRRNLRKGKCPKGMTWTEATLASYGNKNQRIVKAIMDERKKK